jgi:hypothetical protein
MASLNYLSTSPLHEIVKYNKRAFDQKNVVTFRGTVRKHPYDTGKFLLISSPMTDGSHFYEFKIESVVSAKEINRVATETGETIQIVELGIEKGAHGIEMRPFEVG